ncbi:MAG: phenylacetate-CoA oxygenase subunit PaaC [Sphaerobacter sp.]|nr:phenylacetate-CoA oxygenase subunit PaaC [Sphaerobacter sp.]
MTPEAREPLARYLLTIADDELVLGYRDSEWTGVAPIVEEDVAFSSLAQDEIGHARLLYTLAAELTATDPDQLALRRPKGDYYHARLLEFRATPKYDPSGQHQAGGDWAKAIVRRYLYDLFDDLRTEIIAESSYPPLAAAIQKVRREERYHLRHDEAWWHALAGGPAEGRERLERAIAALWPDALGLFEPAPGEERLVAEGILPLTTAELRLRWVERVAPAFARHGIPLPDERAAPAVGGRRGEHGPGWDELYDEMTMVRRLEPDGAW